MVSFQLQQLHTFQFSITSCIHPVCTCNLSMLFSLTQWQRKQKDEKENSSSPGCDTFNASCLLHDTVFIQPFGGHLCLIICFYLYTSSKIAKGKIYIYSKNKLSSFNSAPVTLLFLVSEHGIKMKFAFAI